ncbi:MAG: response regulator [Notoacmeibacter sp.]|nr:response regulator [Notoacmeibacter sp.]MCC0031636.1 response regulator [Brucellaceae bacterium]
MKTADWDAPGARRVLVADDNDVNQLVFRATLEDAGYAVRITGDGRKTVEAALEDRPELIVMDITMPVLDGYDAIGLIRRSGTQNSYHPFIVAVTALAGKADEQKCLDAGADAYLAKPVSPDRLVALLQDVARPG